MKFIKLLYFDIKNGILKNKFLMISMIVFPLLFCIDLWYRITVSNMQGVITTPSSFADYFLYIYGGMKEYVPSPTDPFIFPVIWTIVILVPAFAALNYPLKDIQSFGQQVAYRAKSRYLWWFSKCLWNVLMTLLYHFATVIIILLFCAFLKTGINMMVNRELLQAVYELDLKKLVNGTLAISVKLILVPVLISVGINLLQMALSLFIKSVFSFLSVAAIILASAYLFSPYLPGNYAMIVRSSQFVTNGVDFSKGIFVFFILAILSVLIGAIRFKHYDILNKE